MSRYLRDLHYLFYGGAVPRLTYQAVMEIASFRLAADAPIIVQLVGMKKIPYKGSVTFRCATCMHPSESKQKSG